jgi:Tol biopolymer transport system component
MFAYNRGAQVYVARVDGTGEREVTPGGVEAFTGSWSPDGSLFVYQGRSGDPDVGNIFLVDVTTEEVRRITDLKLSSAWWWYLSPIFSPDGRSVLFQLPRSSDEDTRWDLWSVPVAGGEPTLVRRDASMGAYAPDGETLAYLDSPRGNDGGWSSSLWLADGDGSDPRLLADGDGDFLRWSPDGTRIAFAGDGEIRVVDVATGETSHVVEGGTAEWVDDDTLVVSKFSLTG